MIGSYVLLMELTEPATIKIGKLGNIEFLASWYAYVGSAMNGIQQRVKRHFSKQKKHHWHIDYFLYYAEIKKAYYKESQLKEECDIAGFFSNCAQSISNFGSSDCHCKSHLFYDDKRKLEMVIKKLDMVELYAK